MIRSQKIRALPKAEEDNLSKSLKRNRNFSTKLKSNPSYEKDPQLSDSDQSFDEQNQQTKVKIGKIPYGWYDQFKHFGYDNKLNPVQKQKQLDKIQQFIKKSENSNWWRTIRDQLNAQDIVLSDEQLEIIDRIRSGKMASKTIATADYSYKLDYNDPFPVHAHPPAKKNFMPSKWEQMKVNKILDGLLSGRIKWNPQQEQQEKEQQIFDAWASGQIEERGVINIAPMRNKLPGHNESYNPPKQFLLNQDQRKQWQQMDEEDRPFNFLPASFNKIRHIPFYDKLIQERFQRCLDLYLCPRIKKKKLNIDPDSLIPKLPDPKLLKPFPTAVNIMYNRHQSAVTAISVSPTGDYFCTGDQKGLILIWQTLTSRIMWQKKYEQPILTINWNRNNIIGFSHGEFVELMIWRFSKQLYKIAQELINECKQSDDNNKWKYYETSSDQYKAGLRIYFQFEADVTYLEFQHSKGDYFVTVCPDHLKKNEVISIHRMSKAASETNFINGGGIFKKVSFYPKKPHIVILTQSKIVVYNLEDLTIVKKLSAATNVYSCMGIHPQGSYIMTGSQNQKLICYDVDLSTKPYKTMQFHEKALTSISFHREYPLMASASNDGTIHIFHFKNNTQILQDAVIMPLKVLRGHSIKSMQGVKHVIFHPLQPWVFSVGSDGKVILWT